MMIMTMVTMMIVMMIMMITMVKMMTTMIVTGMMVIPATRPGFPWGVTR